MLTKKIDRVLFSGIILGLLSFGLKFAVFKENRLVRGEGLYLWQLLYQRRGYPRFVSYRELLAHEGLMNSLGQIKKPPVETLRGALEMAVRRGTILHLVLDRDGEDAWDESESLSRKGRGTNPRRRLAPRMEG